MIYCPVNTRCYLDVNSTFFKGYMDVRWTSKQRYVLTVSTTLFGRRYNIFWTLWTSDGRQNNVVCLLGGFSDVFLYIRIRVKLQLPLWYDCHNLVQAVSGNFFLFCFFCFFWYSKCSTIYTAIFILDPPLVRLRIIVALSTNSFRYFVSSW